MDLFCSGLDKEASASAEEKAAPVLEGARLKEELAQSEEERRVSLRKVSQDLDSIASKLDSATGAFVPWIDVASAKQQVASLDNAVNEQIEDARQKQESMEGQQGILDIFNKDGDQRAMENGVVKHQSERRKSLTEVKESLAALAAKLDGAGASWDPAEYVNEAKETAANLQSVVGGHIQREEAERLQGA